jgi:hypothetical protein
MSLPNRSIDEPSSADPYAAMNFAAGEEKQ